MLFRRETSPGLVQADLEVRENLLAEAAAPAFLCRHVLAPGFECALVDREGVVGYDEVGIDLESVAQASSDAAHALWTVERKCLWREFWERDLAS